MTLAEALRAIADPVERRLAETSATLSILPAMDGEDAQATAQRQHGHRTEAVRYRFKHETEFLIYLTRGTWHAIAISLPSMSLELVEPYRWTELTPDFVESAAKGKAGEFVHVRIYRARTEAARAVEIGRVGQPESAPEPTAGAENRCRQWLVSLMKDGPKQKSKSAYQAEAAHQFNVGARGFQRAWAAAIAETGAHEWKRTGRAKKS